MNKIDALQNNEGIWLEGKEELKNMAVDFYSNLFRAYLEVEEKSIKGCFPPIDEGQMHELEAEYTAIETKKALMGMGSWKAPGCDGYQAGCFKGTWEKMGVAVHSFVHDIHKGGEITEEANEVMLILVPNVVKLVSIRSFWPITLCNVSMKMVTKIIANCIKKLMTKWYHITKSPLYQVDRAQVM